MLLEKSIYITKPILGTVIYTGLLSPLIATFFIIYLYYKKEERKDFWLSIIDFKRISWKWYLIIISFPLLIRIFPALIDAVFTGNFKFDLSPEMNPFYAVFLLFFGPIHEELSWRGVALPELQQEYGFKIAVLFLGFMWAIWHLPLFFVKGTYQYQQGLFTPLFWNFMLGVFFTSAVYGVIYNETNKSILAVILFHYIGNLTGETFIMTDQAMIILTLIRGIITLLILIFFKNQNYLLKTGDDHYDKISCTSKKG